MKKHFALGAAFCALTIAGIPPVSAQAPLTAAEKAAEGRLKTATIRSVTTDLAAPGMEGRGTAQPGGDKAAAYLAERFKAIGLKPLGDENTYLQKIAFTTKSLKTDSTIKVEGGETLKPGADFIPLPLPIDNKTNATGELVFVGYGVQSETLKRNDLAGLDVKGKTVLLLGGRPTNVNAAEWRRATGSSQAILQKLIFGGASAVLVADLQAGGLTYDQLASYQTRTQVQYARPANRPAPPMLALPPLIMLGDKGTEKLLVGTGATFADLKTKAATGANISRALGKTVLVSVGYDKAQATGSNVIGVLEGSDPTLKSEAVVVSAHYDGWGKAPDGRVFPGAADNALGVGELVGIAEALAKAPPRRSVIFLAVTGEEHGLLGAEHWVRRPTWPLDKVVANLNFDGIGSETWGPVKAVTGYGAEYSTLGTLFTDAAAVYGLAVVPDPVPEEDVWERSDHFAFVKRGVPALFPLGGPADQAETGRRARLFLAGDYHQTGDVVRPDWNWEGPRTVAALGLLVTERIANAEARPTWLPAGARYRQGTDRQGAVPPGPKQ